MIAATDAADFLTLDELCRRLPDHKLSPRKLTRWIRKGYRGVKLKGRRVGLVWMATPSDLDEFIDKITVASIPAAEPNASAR